jgi:RNA polymerase sigma factor (sigma-70 family)
MYDEYHLLGVLAEDDRRGLQSLVEKYSALVRATCLRALEGDAYAAEDATQAVFVVMAREGHRIRERESLAGWLFTIATMVGQRLGTSASLSRRRAAVVAALKHNLRTPLPEVAGFDKARTLLNQAIVSLDDSQRDAIVMHFLQAKSVRLISRELEREERYIEQRLASGLEGLEEYLSLHGAELPRDRVLKLLKGEAAASEPSGEVAKATVQGVTRILDGDDTSLPVAASVSHEVQELLQTRKRTVPYKLIFIVAVAATALALVIAGM